jgi:hypothetical protein
MYIPAGLELRPSVSEEDRITTARHLQGAQEYFLFRLLPRWRNGYVDLKQQETPPSEKKEKVTITTRVVNDVLVVLSMLLLLALMGLLSLLLFLSLLLSFFNQIFIFHSKHWNGFFNWTMTYRKDSDFPHPYGHVVKIRNHPTNQANTKHVSFCGQGCQMVYFQTVNFNLGKC